MSDKEKDYYQNYNFNDRKPVFIDEDELRPDQLDKLVKSDVFCMMPWIHLHGFPDGRAYPCCHGSIDAPVGNLKKDTMEVIWNSTEYKSMRKNMLEETKCKECVNCYEQEASGFISGRNSANKHFGHHISLVDTTKDDGQFDEFKLRYYDIRFSNLCNMSCRTCGSLFSSSWYAEETKLFGARPHPQIMFAGQTENDMWEQLLPHIPYIEQIYFAGGEPLIMEEHYRLLTELVRQERFDVKIIYNTNFSRLNLKNDNVLEYWKLFNSVSVGASLDGMGPRGEYIRKGTKWDDIVRNRERMIETCPNVDFYVSSTVSLYNAFHISDFHKEWVNKGLINPQDWNINILQGPTRDRIDVLPAIYKQELEEKILQHIYWLGPKDKLKRATNGYKSMISYMQQNNNTHLLKEFFKINDQFDELRKETFQQVFPEYKDLRLYAT
jgi:radical SAM protein with 4Fe4S-binding SPASM domain